MCKFIDADPLQIVLCVRELFLSILGEHRNEDVVNNFHFRLVKSCDFNENISRFNADLRVIAVDDGW